MNRVAVAVVLLALLGVAACSGESRLTAEFRPVQPGIQEEIGMEGSR